MNTAAIVTVIGILKKYLETRQTPIVAGLAEKEKNPFKILISTLLSLRTKDEVTAEAAERLFHLAVTPEDMLNIPEEIINKTIFPVGFYKTKAKTIHHVCRELIKRYHSRVPDTMDELLSLKGVGRKTANLVIALGYDGPGLCVDTHVHRISNRFGYVATSSPEKTEFALREKLPEQYWRIYNTLMVAFGREVCRPVSPLCSLCPVAEYCDRIGVQKSR